MSGIGGSRRGVYASKSRLGNAIYEEIVPEFEWIEDSSNHWLGLEVPGFRREEVKLEVNTYGLIKIAGERKISEIKYIWFEQIFQAPQNSKPEDCRVGLEDGLFYVQIPKKATHKYQVHTPAKTPRPEEEEDSHHEKGKKVNDSSEGTIEKIPASTPTKPPKDEEGSDRDKAKKVNEDSCEGTNEKIPAATPTDAPTDEEDSDREKGKKVNDDNDEFHNKDKYTVEEIPTSTPTKPPKDEEGSDRDKAKKVNDDSGEGTNEKIPAATPTDAPRDEEDSDREKGKKVNDDNDEFHNKDKSTVEEIPTSTPTNAPKDEQDSNQEKGKIVNDNGDCPNKSKGTNEYLDAKGEDKSNFWAKVAKMVIHNKGILVTTILILSAGFLVSPDKIKRVKYKEKLFGKLDSQNHNDDDE